MFQEILDKIDEIDALLTQRINPVELARFKNKKRGTCGKIRVGKIASRFDKGPKYPVSTGYINIVVASVNKTKLGKQLTPFTLMDSEKRIMENIWQFSKLYSQTSAISTKNWSWPTSKHFYDGDLLPAYWKWRKRGMNHHMAVRSPVPKCDRGRCLGCVWPTNSLGKNMTLDSVHLSNILDTVNTSILPYIEARVYVYSPLYMLLARKTDDFETLQELLQDGYNLQLIEPDGPRRETDENGDPVPPYDKMTAGEYGENKVGSIPINEEIINKLINNVTQPFGHCFILATMLLGKEEWIHNSL